MHPPAQHRLVEIDRDAPRLVRPPPPGLRPGRRDAVHDIADQHPRTGRLARPLAAAARRQPRNHGGVGGDAAVTADGSGQAGTDGESLISAPVTITDNAVGALGGLSEEQKAIATAYFTRMSHDAERGDLGAVQRNLSLSLRIVGLTRSHQFHPMPACAQTVAQAAKGIGHAVDFRWKGFADEGDM